MIKKLQALRAKKGFTLVELIVVIAIIGVLAAILVPVMMGQVTKAKINSLDSTAKTVVTTVNAWVADRYGNGKTGGIDGTWNYTKAGGVTGATSDTNTWGITAAASDNTSLNFALADAYNFAADDFITFFIENGKCTAAVYKQTAAVSGVTYSSASGWSGCGVSNAKDGIVNEGSASGAMIGTYPKCKTAFST